MPTHADAHWPEPVMSDLAPCPTCGGSRAAADLVVRDGKRVWTILCPACGTERPADTPARGFEDAVARWNHARR